MRIANIDIKFEQKGNFSGLMVYPFMFCHLSSWLLKSGKCE